MRSLAGAIAGFYAGRYLAQAFDDFTRIQNTLKGFGVSSRSVDRVTESITKLANEARTSSVETATLFGRLRLATRDLGLTEKDVLELTGTLNKALRLSGSSGLEASQSVRQLSQAFNKGKLDGDEFRSVLENAPILTKLLTKELQISKTELYAWAQAGKITTRVLARAVKNGAKEIDKAFSRISPTIGDAFQRLWNQVRQFLGTAPEAQGAVKALTGAIGLLGDNLSTVLAIMEVYAAGFIFGKVITLFTKLAAGARILSSALKGLAATEVLVAGSSAAAAAAGAGGVAQAGFPAPLIGLPARGGAAAAGAAAAGAGKAAQAGFPVALVSAGFAKTAKESKKVESIWKRLGGILKSFGGFITRGLLLPFKLVFRAVSLLVGGPVRLLVVALGALAFSTGFLDGLKQATGETSKWAALVTTLGRAWRVVFRNLKSGAAGAAVGLDWLYTQFSNFFDRLISLFRAVFLLLGQMLSDFVRDMILEVEGVLRVLEALNIPTSAGRKAIANIESGLRKPSDKTYWQQLKDGYNETMKELANEGGALGLIATTALDVGRAAGAAFANAFESEEVIDSYTEAVAPLREELDKLQDSFEKLSGIEDLASKAAISLPDDPKKYNAFIRDLTENQIRDLSGATQFEVDAFDRKRKKDAGDPFETPDLDAARATIENNTTILKQYKEMVKTLEQIRATYPEEGREFVDRQVLAAGRDPSKEGFGTDPTDLQNVRSMIEGTNKLSEFLSNVSSEVEGLEAAISQAEGGAGGIKAVEAAISSLQEKLKAEAEKLPEPIRAAAFEAAQKLVDAANLVLTDGARIIAENVKAAFLGVIPGLQAIAAFGTQPRGDGQLGAPGQQILDQNAITNVQKATTAVGDLNENLGATEARVNRFTDTFPNAFKQLGGAAKKTANDFEQFFQSAFGTLEDALVEFVTTGEFDFKKFINAIIADLARLLIRMLIIRPLMSFFGGIFGFAKGGLVPGAFGVGGGTVQKLASGGVVGDYGGTIQKFGSGGVIGGYGGTNSDSHLVAASSGEFVMNAAATRRNLSDLVRMNNGGTVSQRRRVGGSSTINFAPQITVVNESGSDQDGQQQGEQIGAMVRQSFTELLMKETRPGGMLESVNRKGFA